MFCCEHSVNNRLVYLAITLFLTACSSFTGDAKPKEPFLYPNYGAADPVLLEQLTQELEELQFHAVLVVKDGGLVYEEYFAREDEEWGRNIGLREHDATTLHDLRSGTKSIVAALVGIAIAEGSIPGLNTPVTELLDSKTLSNYRPPPDYSTLRLSHLLSMTAGFDWNERISYANPDNPELRMWASETPVSFALSQTFITGPGKVFNYNGGLTQILVEILEQNTGQPLDTYAREKLFTPLRIRDAEWVRHKNNQVWGASGLRLNARDFAKFGRLYLQIGQWDGAQVVPADWVKNTFQPRIDTGFPMKMDYGLHW